MDGNGCLFGTLSGNTREVLHKFSVDLPKKHGRGGQSALRFARLRMEKRHNYVRKVCTHTRGVPPPPTRTPPRAPPRPHTCTHAHTRALARANLRYTHPSTHPSTHPQAPTH
jgi:hypothetical protein